MTNYIPSEIEVDDEIERLIPLINKKFKKHSLIDLTDFINTESKEGFKHPGFVRNMAFKMEARGEAEVIPRKDWNEFYIKRTIFSKRHPYKYYIILLCFGLFFSVIAGFANALFQTWLKCK